MGGRRQIGQEYSKIVLTGDKGTTGAAAPHPHEVGDAVSRAAAGLAARLTTTDWLAAGAVTAEFAPGEIIFRENARPRAFYLLLSGQVYIIRRGEALERLGPGDFFGEIGLLDERPRTATVQVTEDGPATLMALDRTAFTGMLRNSPELAAALTAVSGQRLEADSMVAAFPCLDSTALDGLVAGAQRLRFTQGETIVRQGEPAERPYLVVRGRVELLYKTPQGHTFLAGFLEAGETFGAGGLLIGAPHLTTMRAAEDVELLALDGEAFTAVLAAHDDARTALQNEQQRRRQRLDDLGGSEP